MAYVRGVGCELKNLRRMVACRPPVQWKNVMGDGGTLKNDDGR